MKWGPVEFLRRAYFWSALKSWLAEIAGNRERKDDRSEISIYGILGRKSRTLANHQVLRLLHTS